MPNTPQQNVITHIRAEIEQISKAQYPGFKPFGQNPDKRWPIYLNESQIQIIIEALNIEILDGISENEMQPENHNKP